MFWFNFGRWSRSADSLFICERVYRYGWQWTPLIWIRPRYVI